MDTINDDGMLVFKIGLGLTSNEIITFQPALSDTHELLYLKSIQNVAIIGSNGKFFIRNFKWGLKGGSRNMPELELSNRFRALELDAIHHPPDWRMVKQRLISSTDTAGSLLSWGGGQFEKKHYCPIIKLKENLQSEETIQKVTALIDETNLVDSYLRQQFLYNILLIQHIKAILRHRTSLVNAIPTSINVTSRRLNQESTALIFPELETVDGENREGNILKILDSLYFNRGNITIDICSKILKLIMDYGRKNEFLVFSSFSVLLYTIISMVEEKKNPFSNLKILRKIIDYFDENETIKVNHLELNHYFENGQLVINCNQQVYQFPIPEDFEVQIVKKLLVVNKDPKSLEIYSFIMSMFSEEMYENEKANFEWLDGNNYEKWKNEISNNLSNFSVNFNKKASNDTSSNHQENFNIVEMMMKLVQKNCTIFGKNGTVGNSLQSTQLLQVYDHFAGEVQSYLSNNRKVEKLFLSSYTAELEKPWEFTRLSRKHNWVFIDPDHISLKLQNEEIFKLAATGGSDRKMDLCSKATIKKNGSLFLNITGYAVHLGAMRGNSPTNFNGKKQHILFNPRTLSKILDPACIQMNAGFCKMTLNGNQLELNIPVSMKTNPLHVPTPPKPPDTPNDSIICPSIPSVSIDAVAVAATKKRDAWSDKIRKEMEKKYNATIWRYIEGRDPSKLQNVNNFGFSIWVIRNSKYEHVNKEHQLLFQDTISVDPGLKTFKTIFNLGNGDVYMLAPGLAESLKEKEKKVSVIQSQIDKKVNENAELIALKAIWEKSIAERGKADPKLWEKIYQSEKEKERKYWEEKKKFTDDNFKDLQDSILKIRESVKRKIKNSHLKCRQFETSFKLILDPEFKPDQQMLKKKKGQLPKIWKSTASWMAHGKYRTKLIFKQGILGQAVTTVSEACSTMQCPSCMTLHSPGINRLHHCPNRKCRMVANRDAGAARAIAHHALTRVLFSNGGKDGFGNLIPHIS